MRTARSIGTMNWKAVAVLATARARLYGTKSSLGKFWLSVAASATDFHLGYSGDDFAGELYAMYESFEDDGGWQGQARQWIWQEYGNLIDLFGKHVTELGEAMKEQLKGKAR